MLSSAEVRDLKIFAKQIQIETVKCIASIGKGHLGGSLSIADVLAVLYGRYLQCNPEDPQWALRDYLVLSKGHAGPALYAVLALKGFFDKKLLLTLNRPHTTLPSHVDRLRTPGVDMTCGSLGQGASVAAGMALALKLDSKPNTVYLIMGDGEQNEGQIWEAALFAAAKNLKNLIAFVDRNHFQLDAPTEQICPLGDVAAKYEQFGWYAQTVNGRDPAAISAAIDAAKKKEDERPSVIVLDTIKGDGWSKSAGQLRCHSCVVTAQDAAEAEAEMCAAIEQLREET